METNNLFSPHNTVVDTTAFISLLWRNDVNHLRAKVQYERLLDIHSELYTSNYILLEVENWIMEHKVSATFFSILGSAKDLVNVVYLDKNYHEHAERLLESNREFGANLTDFTTRLLANKLKARIFAFDQKLADIGGLLIPFGE